MIWKASNTSRYHADEMNQSDGGWSCNPSKINIPCFMVAGTKDFDAGNVDEYPVGKLTEGSTQSIYPMWWLDECYNAIPYGVDKVIARRVHADGYMTALFMYWLKGDTAAENAEILANANWQDIKVNHK